jgi:hypothetical protein
MGLSAGRSAQPPWDLAMADHFILSRFRPLQKRSTAFVLAFRPRDALKSWRPASEGDLHLPTATTGWRRDAIFDCAWLPKAHGSSASRPHTGKSTAGPGSL